MSNTPATTTILNAPNAPLRGNAKRSITEFIQPRKLFKESDDDTTEIQQTEENLVIVPVQEPIHETPLIGVNELNNRMAHARNITPRRRIEVSSPPALGREEKIAKRKASKNERLSRYNLRERIISDVKRKLF